MKPRKRLSLLFTFLALTAFAGAGNMARNHMLERELERAGLEKLAELVESTDLERVDLSYPVVTVARPYAIFGKPVGKISIYFRDNGGEDGNAPPDDAHRHGPISGIDYFLERGEAGWTAVESSRCASDQCAVEGAAAFREGIYVPPGSDAAAAE